MLCSFVSFIYLTVFFFYVTKKESVCVVHLRNSLVLTKSHMPKTHTYKNTPTHKHTHRHAYIYTLHTRLYFHNIIVSLSRSLSPSLSLSLSLFLSLSLSLQSSCRSLYLSTPVGGSTPPAPSPALSLFRPRLPLPWQHSWQPSPRQRRRATL